MLFTALKKNCAVEAMYHPDDRVESNQLNIFVNCLTTFQIPNNCNCLVSVDGMLIQHHRSNQCFTDEGQQTAGPGHKS